METEINVNTTQTPEPISQPGADFETFEQLESFMDNPKSSNKELDKATVEKRLAKDKGESNAEEKETQESQETSQEIEEPQKEKEVKKELAKKAADDLTKQKARLYKIKHGDKDLDLSADTEFDIKVDGKPEKAKLQELISNYSGKVNWDRQYSKLDTERKTFQSDLKTINDRINQAFDLAVTKNNPRAAIQYIAELMGANPMDVIKRFEDQIKTQIDEWGKLSPEEARAKKAEQEAEFYRDREKQRLTEAETLKTREEIGNRVGTIQEKLGIDNDTFLRLYNELKITGKYSDDTLTPELVGEYYQDLKTYDAVKLLVNDAKIDQESQGKVTQELFGIWRQNPDFTKEDIAEIAGRVYGSKIARNLNRKVKKSDSDSVQKVETRKGHEPLTFEDLGD